MSISIEKAVAVSVNHLSNDVLVVSNLGINGFSSIDKSTLAYKPMLEASLINEDRTAKMECLAKILEAEVNFRETAGVLK